MNELVSRSVSQSALLTTQLLIQSVGHSGGQSVTVSPNQSVSPRKPTSPNQSVAVLVDQSVLVRLLVSPNQSVSHG